MQYVKLLKDVAEGGRDFKKAIKAADALGIGKRNGKYPKLKRESWGSRVTFTKGRIITMSERSARKWVRRGLASVVKPRIR